MWKGSDLVTNLALDFTTQCNLRCNYCYLYSKQDIEADELSVESLIEVTKKAFKYFPNIEKIELWGGEPTLNPKRITSFVNEMTSLGKSVWAPSTNGTLLGVQKNYNAWKLVNDKGCQVSFDGNKQYHDKYRCNTHDLVVKNLKRCVNFDDNVSLRTTYRFDDFYDAIITNMVEFPRLYKEFLNDCSNHKRVDKLFAIRPYKNRKLMMIYQEVDSIYTKDEILQKAPLYRQYYELLDSVIDNYLDNDVIFMPPYIGDTVEALLSDKDFIEPKNCGSFVSQLYLHAPSGDIYPCLSEDVEQYKDIGCLMNVHTGDINWSAVNTVRSFMFRRNRKCYTCFLQSSCFGGCYHQAPSAKNKFNSYWNISNISKCVFSHSIFDVVVNTSQRIIDYIDKTSK